MPECSAKGCRNASRKGVKMNYFPRDPVRREQWRSNCAILGGMHGWLPRDSSALCEYHFSADKWEKIRVDGTKKLKANAVPTIFGELVCQITEKIQKKPVQNVGDGEMLMVFTDPVTKEVKLLMPVTRKIEMKSYLDNKTTSKRSPIRFEMRRVLSSPKSTETTPNHKVGTNDSHESSQAACSSKQTSDSSNHHARTDLDPSHATPAKESASNENESGDKSTQQILDQREKENRIEEMVEKTLSNSYAQIKSIDPKTNLMEKYKRLEYLYLKSEKLRILMRKRHKQKYDQFRYTVKKLKKKYYELKARAVLVEDRFL